MVVEDSAATAPEETEDVKAKKKEEEGKGDGQGELFDQRSNIV